MAALCQRAPEGSCGSPGNFKWRIGNEVDLAGPGNSASRRHVSRGNRGLGRTCTTRTPARHRFRHDSVAFEGQLVPVQGAKILRLKENGCVGNHEAAMTNRDPGRAHVTRQELGREDSYLLQ